MQLANLKNQRYLLVWQRNEKKQAVLGRTLDYTTRKSTRKSSRKIFNVSSPVFDASLDESLEYYF